MARLARGMTGLSVRGKFFCDRSLRSTHRSSDGRRVQLRIKDFKQMPKGPSAFVECETGEDFFPAAKVQVRQVFQVPENSEIHFCCYIDDAPNRFEFNSASGYWNITPGSPIYFWTGPSPPSPDNHRKTIEAQLSQLKRDVLRLQATSSSATVQGERWAQAGPLGVEEVETCFKDPINIDRGLLERAMAKKRSPKEKGVQERHPWRFSGKGSIGSTQHLCGEGL